MVERRALTEGLKPPPPPVDTHREQQFMQAAKSNIPVPSIPSPVSRVPISTRMRGDFAELLKRASLERQLNKVEPNSLQDILEQAVEPWLKANGYLP